MAFTLHLTWQETEGTVLSMINSGGVKEWSYLVSDNGEEVGEVFLDCSPSVIPEKYNKSSITKDIMRKLSKYHAWYTSV